MLTVPVIECMGVGQNYHTIVSKTRNNTISPPESVKKRNRMCATQDVPGDDVETPNEEKYRKAVDAITVLMMVKFGKIKEHFREINKRFEPLEAEIKGLNEIINQIALLNAQNLRLSERVAILEEKFLDHPSQNEINILGIDNSITLKPNEIAVAVLGALNLCNPAAAIVDARFVRVKPNRKTPKSSEGVDAAKQSSSLARTLTKSLFVTLTSRGTRALIMGRTRKRLTCSNIFPGSASTPIFINEAYPASTYRLLVKTRKVCKNAGYLKPIVVDNIITVKRNKSSESMHIVKEKDLQGIKPFDK